MVKKKKNVFGNKGKAFSSKGKKSFATKDALSLAGAAVALTIGIQGVKAISKL